MMAPPTRPMVPGWAGCCCPTIRPWRCCRPTESCSGWSSQGLFDFDPVGLGLPPRLRCCVWKPRLPLGSRAPATQAAASDLIIFIKALPFAGCAEASAFPSGGCCWCRSFRSSTLHELLRADFGNFPSDSMFRLLLAQPDLQGLETLPRNWMVAQPSMAEELDTMISGGRRYGAPSLRTTPAHRV
jgi:hypothetical protein